MTEIEKAIEQATDYVDNIHKRWIEGTGKLAENVIELMADFAIEYAKERERERETWISTSDRLPKKEGDEIEVLCFNSKWINEDWNPNGTSIGTYSDMGWTVTEWDPNNDDYSTRFSEDDEIWTPTHWMKIPKQPTVEDYLNSKEETK